MYSLDVLSFEKIGPEIEDSSLSDEACEQGWFTGAMVGICCQDMTGDAIAADFDWFKYNTSIER
ncbi:hypothetical protein [Metabacillus niabensis]|uniref:beta-xylosidase family glycoside hydrolase n=1 Tax=Metabacillus niabensis TaxID=324854 RepID=UPI001CFB568B|nr:hypothetical protein [Metabacillus niabensis]